MKKEKSENKSIPKWMSVLALILCLAITSVSIYIILFAQPKINNTIVTKSNKKTRELSAKSFLESVQPQVQKEFSGLIITDSLKIDSQNDIIVEDDKFNLITAGESYGLSFNSKQYQEDVYTMKETKIIGDFYAKVLEQDGFRLLKQFDSPNGPSEYHDKLFYSNKNNLYCSSGVGSFGFDNKFQYSLVCAEKSRILDIKKQLEKLLSNNVITSAELKQGLVVGQMLQSKDARRATLTIGSVNSEFDGAARPIFRVSKNSAWQRYLKDDIQSVPLCSDVNKDTPKDLMITCLDAGNNTVDGVDKGDFENESSLITVF
jgi:hypothetical protein